MDGMCIVPFDYRYVINWQCPFALDSSAYIGAIVLRISCRQDASIYVCFHRDSTNENVEYF